MRKSNREWLKVGGFILIQLSLLIVGCQRVSTTKGGNIQNTLNEVDIYDTIISIDSASYNKNIVLHSIYKNQKLFEEVRYNTQGEKFGWYYKYYDNGQIEFEGQYFKNYKFDYWNYYTKDGKKKKTIEFIPLLSGDRNKSQNWANRLVVFDVNEEVIRDSSAYADFQITNKDTFEIGEEIKLSFKIYDPLYHEHDSTGLIIRDFELPYFGYIPNAESKEYSLDSNLAINISLEAEGNIGKNHITGMLFEQDAVTKTYHSYYFYIPYYIK